MQHYVVAIERCGLESISGNAPRWACLFLTLPHDPAEIGPAWEQYAGCRRRLNEELIAFDPVMAPLLGTVPDFIPRNINGRDEVITFDTVFPGVGARAPAR